MAVERIIIDSFMYEMSIRGANFCQVISNMQVTHDIPSITPGNQKCIGAAPAFISSAIMIVGFDIIIIVFVDIDSSAAVISIADPTAWMMKYFRADSIERCSAFFAIIGINDNRLISNPIHAPNQDEDETLIIVPIIRVNMNNVVDFFIIRIEDVSYRWGMSPIAYLAYNSCTMVFRHVRF